MTVASNQFQSHDQLLRHGMLNWVTRGVFLGYQRNYLELQVDDLFLGDDAWDPATHTTNYDPARGEPDDAGRRRPGDRLVAGARPAPRLRLQRRRQRALQGRQTARRPTRWPTPSPTRPTRGAFGFINHTYDHPNLDCSTALVHHQGRSPTTSPWAQRHGLPLDPAEVVTGEHSGPGQLAPGQPGHDRPAVVRRRRARRAGGAIPAGTYDYALTAQSAAGETTASVVAGVAGRGRRHSVTATLQRRLPRDRLQPLPQPGGRRQRGRVVGTLHARRQRADRRRHATRSTLTITDTAAAGTAGGAARGQRRRARALRQNPNYLARPRRARASRYVATRRLEGLPVDPDGRHRARRARRARPSPRARRRSAGARATRATSTTTSRARASSSTSTTGSTSRRPTAAAACRSPGVTTCRTTPATWADYVDEREHRHVPPRHGQRPAAALHAPEQPRRLQPGAARDRPRPGRHPLPGHRRPAGALRGGVRPRRARRWCS